MPLLKDGRTLTISRTSIADAAACVAYIEQVSGESDNLTFGPGEFGFTPDDEAKFIETVIDGKAGVQLKATVDGKIVSLASLSRRTNRPRVYHAAHYGISVLKEFWGLGIGRLITLAIIEEARKIGVTKIDLEVRTDNPSAIALYESVGFAHEGTNENAMKIGGKYFSNYRMGLILD